MAPFSGKISLFSQSMFPLPLHAAIQATADAGFPAIELACRDPHFGIATARADAEAVARSVRDAGLAVSALSLFNGFTDESTHAQHVEEAATLIQLAPTFGTDVVKLTPGGPSSREATDEHWRLVGSAIDALAPIAEGVGARLAFETHMRQLTDTLAGTLRLLDIAPRETVGLTVDFSNLRFAGEDLRDAVPKVAHRMINAHVKNGELGQDGAWLFGRLDTGLTDYAELLPMLCDVGYGGYLAIECLGPDAAEQPVDTARRDLSILRGYLSALAPSRPR